MCFAVFQELSSLLSMHGFQSLEDFGGLKESHLNELNITDPDQRSKILNAIEMIRDCRFTSSSPTFTHSLPIIYHNCPPLKASNEQYPNNLPFHSTVKTVS